MPARPLPATTFGPAFRARFEAHVLRGPWSECWPWTGPVNSGGYGRAYIEGSEHKAHRVALALSLGTDVPTDELVLHSCDNPPCCNPRHLRLGTQTDNAADRHARGRGHVNPKGVNSTRASRVVPFRLPADTADALNDHAAAQGVSVSQLLRGLVADLLA